jgi:FAD/FMN-containing dehydrogenase
MTRTAADWESFERTIAGAVVLPDSPDYQSVRKPAMARFDHIEPAAVVLCESPDDVAATIAFARRVGLESAVRSGGHSVAGRSSTEGIVIDVTPMSSVSVADGVATVGSGARLGALYDALEEHGLTIPAGCGPSVGIGGLTLGGGIGILGRTHGLTCDHLVRADVVLADGRLVQCDEHHNEDLFWGLRGAGGGNLGVVTSFVFRTLWAPATTVFRLIWPFADAAALVEAWQVFVPTGPDELDATLRLAAGGAGEPVVEVVGACLGTEADAAVLLDQLIAEAAAEPTSASRRHMPYREAKRYLDELGAEGEQGSPEERPRGHLFTKSEFFRRPLPPETIAALVQNVLEAARRGQSSEVTFTPWGGAYNRVPTDATAFPHRDELFLVQHLVLIDPTVTELENEAARDWLRRSWAIAHAHGSGGVYPNFPDTDLGDWARAYHGPNYDRLRRVKAKYDPTNFFRFEQSIPT